MQISNTKRTNSGAVSLVTIALWAVILNAVLLYRTGQAQDPSHGQELFEKRCLGCHALDKEKGGPRLRGVYGRTSGTVPSFKYADALKNAHIAWDNDSLDKWLTDPEKLVANNDMAFRKRGGAKPNYRLLEATPGAVIHGDGFEMSRLNDHTIDELAIIDRIKAKDESAFQEFFERYRRAVLSIIFRTLGKHNDNEDIAQQVFANFYFSINSFDHRCSLSTWIHRLTVNECYSYLRKKRVRKLLYESDFTAEDSFGMASNSAVVDLRPRIDVGLENRDLVDKLLEGTRR